MGTLTAQTEAYEKAMKDDWNAMVEFYERGLYLWLPLTVARDSALHVAVQSKKAYPLNKLLDIFEENFLLTDIESDPGINHPVYAVNAYGNTVLHQAATVGNYEAVELLASRFPLLIEKTNKYGETPLFRAASFGETKIVHYLAAKVAGQIADGNPLERHRTRINGTSILHVAVQGEHFDTALLLLNLDNSLGELKGRNNKTAFHLQAGMSSAFKSGYPMGVFTMILYSCLPVEESIEEYITLAYIENKRHHMAKWIYLSVCKVLFNGWPIMKKVWDEKRKHEFALRLAKMLIKTDFSWERFVETSDSSSSGFIITMSYDSREDQEQQGQGSSMDVAKTDNSSKNPHDKETKEVEEDKNNMQNQGLPLQQLPPGSLGPQQFQQSHEEERTEDDKKDEKKTVNYIPTPLFIATENGIMEIVEQILNEYPQAVEHIDNNGRNILHVAITHRRKKIFDLVIKRMRMPVARLKLGVDNGGYTLLHHAADTKYYTGGSKPGPALQLQEELQWFEKVQELVPSHYAMHREKSKNRYTASELFKEKHQGQLKDAQQWVKDTSQSCSTVAVLVATVVFAAAYTVPGGSNDRGVPIFLHSPYFLFFTIMDVVSLACSLTSVVMFLSILTSPFELQEFRHSLPRKLTFGFTLLFFSVVTTMLTFGATILLTIHLEQKLTTSLLSVAAFFPVFIFALMQFRLYVSFMGTMKELVNDVAKCLPSCFLPSSCCRDKLF